MEKWTAPALFPSRASGAGILSRNLLPLFAMFTGDPGSSDSERCINAQITAYRHVVHGVAPPPVVWQEAAVHVEEFARMSDARRKAAMLEASKQLLRTKD